MKPFRRALIFIALSAYFVLAGASAQAADDPADLQALAKIISAMPAGEWLELPNSSIRPSFPPRGAAPNNGGDGPDWVIRGETGAAFDGRHWYFLGSGAYSGNEVYDFDFATLKWARLTEPSKLKPSTPDKPCADTADGTPLSARTWDAITYVPTTGSIWMWPVGYYCQSGSHARDLVWEFDPKRRSWQSHPANPAQPAIVASSFDPASGRVVLYSSGITEWFNPKTNQYFGKSPYEADIGEGASAIDVSGRWFWAVTRGELFSSRMDDAQMGPFGVVARGADLPPGVSFTSGLAFDSKRHRLVFWSGDRKLMTYDPAAKRWTEFTTPSGPGPFSVGSRILSKWIYIASLDAFAGYANPEQGIWIYKPISSPAAAVPLLAGVKRVCPNANYDTKCDYDRLCAALAAAKDGDTITMRAGTYREACPIKANRITIKAEPGAHLTGLAYGGKANLVIEGNDTVIEGLECSHGYAEGNGACLRIEGHNVTIRHMHIHDEQMGILSGGANGTIDIEDTLIENIGLPNSDLSHCIYISESPHGIADEFILRHSIIRNSRFEGHLVKSRAIKTIIENNLLSSLDDNDSREIDLSQGGVAVIRNNVIEKGPKSDNWDFIGIALEKGVRSTNDTLIEGNWFISDHDVSVLMTTKSPGEVRVIHNKIVGVARERLVDPKAPVIRPISASDNQFFTDRKQAGLQPYPFLPAVGQ